MKFLLLILSFFASVQLRAQEENWQVYIASFEQKPGSVMVNMHLKESAPIRQLPFVLVVGVKYPGCSSDGFPEQGAFDQLYTISDSIKLLIPQKAMAKPVGSFTHDCDRLDYYYLADTNSIRSVIIPFIEKNYPTYKPYLNIKKDSAWTYYLDFLYPNEYYQELISNQQITLQLMQAGDDLTRERLVDHWLYFASKKDRDCFVQYAQQLKFSIEKKSFNGELKLPYTLQINRVDLVEPYKITELTLELQKKAAACNGKYDGWETFVIK